jgi:TRAP-type C4-dicarboxylate transport system substrate-binding protein
VLKDHTVDAKVDPLGLIVLMKMYEVQTYLSLTNHWWSGFTLVANAHVWQAVPSDLQTASTGARRRQPLHNGRTSKRASVR